MSGDALTLEGLVLSEARGDVFVLDVAVGLVRRRVLAKRSGRLVKHNIRIVAGDLVTVELSPYDLARGRITFRGRREEGAT
jgi:translation initiation factor IF-1